MTIIFIALTIKLQTIKPAGIQLKVKIVCSVHHKLSDSFVLFVDYPFLLTF